MTAHQAQPFVEVSTSSAELENEKKVFDFFKPVSAAKQRRAYEQACDFLKRQEQGTFECVICTHTTQICDSQSGTVNWLLDKIRSCPSLKKDYRGYRTFCVEHCDKKNHIRACNSCLQRLRHREDISAHRFAATSMGEVPKEISDLSCIEQMLIARAIPRGHFVRLKPGAGAPETGHMGLVGNTATLPTNAAEKLAERLPRAIADVSGYISVIAKNTQDVKAWRGFQIRRGFVLRALEWLRDHNPAYSDVEIVGHMVKALPENEVFNIQLHNCVVTEDSKGSERVLIRNEPSQPAHEGFIPPDLADPSTLRDVISVGVASDAKPLPEYGCGTLLASMFPWIFPYGTGTPEDDIARKSEDFRSACSRTLKAFGGRAAREPRLVFKLYDIYRLRHNNECKRLIMRVSRDIPRRVDITVDDLLQAHFKPDEAKEEAKKILRSVHVALRGLPHTQSHKLLMKDKLVSLMVYQGPPLLWFTFNPADLYSKVALAAAGVDPDDFENYDSVKDRASKLVEVPQAVVDNFDIHEHAILEMMVLEHGILGDYDAVISAIEAQQRGGPHSHSLVHPPIDFPHATFVRLLQTPKLRNSIAEFWDSVRRTELPVRDQESTHTDRGFLKKRDATDEDMGSQEQQVSDSYWREARPEVGQDPRLGGGVSLIRILFLIWKLLFRPCRNTPVELFASGSRRMVLWSVDLDFPVTISHQASLRARMALCPSISGKIIRASMDTTT